MRISQIWRYPVKSMGGHRVAAATITETGIAGDRSWGVVDDETGTVLTGRREPRLLMATATLDDEGPLIPSRKGTRCAPATSCPAGWAGP